jgi:hypothetical protein
MSPVSVAFLISDRDSGIEGRRGELLLSIPGDTACAQTFSPRGRERAGTAERAVIAGASQL